MNCLSEIGQAVKPLCASTQVVIVSSPPIFRRFGGSIQRSLKRVGLHAAMMVVPDGERAKSLRWASALYDRLIRGKYERGATLVALGGGVIGDLTGFVASTYLRGVPYIQLPTTLVAQVDASIGGKTAVNHPRGKNLIGTFYQPALVFSDVAVLRSLPKRQLVGGLAEVVKYGVIADAGLFAYLEEHCGELLDARSGPLEQIVFQSARIKADVVVKDEREAGLRRVLNYGHTLGHAIEATTGFRRFHHGEAVAIGMQFAAQLSAGLGLCDDALVSRQRKLLERIGLPAVLPARLDQQRLLAAMALDKKVKGGQWHFVLPERLGRVRVEPVEAARVRQILAAFARERAAHT
ncbi:MAG: 3-dehydroquinate synthase [Nitrospirota bacterium]